MIIWGGEPPVIENPEPRFNSVILKLNKVVEAVRSATGSFNDDVDEKLETVTTNLNEFIANVSQPIDAHLAARLTPQHNETKASIGLSKRDNYRTATVAESVAFAPVQAFVTPLGAKTALVTNNASFVSDNYQQNDLFQFGSYYYPDEYPVLTPGRVEPIRYLGSDKKTGILINDDRLVFSPVSDTSQYQNQLIFTSLPTSKAKGRRLAEIPNLSDRFLTAGWNTMGCDTNTGKVAFFKALADKKVYLFTNNLGALPAGNRNYLLYESYASVAYKGLAVSSSSAGTVVTLNHRFFYVANFTTAPALTELLTSSYLAVFDRLDTPQYVGPASGSESFDILNYVTLPAGAVLTIGGGSHGIVTSLHWNVPNVEMYLHIAVPVTVTLNGVSQKLVFSFILSIKPGSLVTGGTASFTQLGTRTKDVIGVNLLPVGTANWFSDGNLYNLLNKVQYPGVLLNHTGELVKVATGKYGTKVKRYDTSFTGLIPYLQDKTTVIDPKLATREMYCPSRHAAFGLMPERIIPFAHAANGLTYLVYGHNPLTGRFGWRTFNWGNGNPVSTEASGKFGLRLPDVITDKSGLSAVPNSLSVYTSRTVAGVTLSGAVFNETNNYTGVSGFAYDGTTVTPGSDIKLDTLSLIKMRVLGAGVLSRAAVANPGVSPTLRKVQIQVFRLTAAKALVVISDGVNYAEAGIANWVLTGSTFTVTFDNTGGVLKLSPVTPSGQVVGGVNRSSASGDDVWLPHSDVLISAIDANTFNIVLTRPFGNDLYGDISFKVLFALSVTPSFTVGAVNPVRLYSAIDAFDTVTELYPAICIPAKGLYQFVPTNGQFANNMKEVDGTTIVDPFDINQTGWVRLPAGSRIVLNGRTIILDRDYAVQVAATGVFYCYLQLVGGTLSVVAAAAPRQPSNNEVQFGVVTNGILVMNKSYIVMDSRVISSSRHGGTIPCFLDDGGRGVNNFFTTRDVKS